MLIATTRYSTFVKHSSEDIGAALTSLGCDVRTLIERDDHARINGVAYLRAIEAFDPDLLLIINYPRACVTAPLPANVPYVCWIQDAMTHLFDANVGAAQGEMDFIVGHTQPDLFEKFGYTRQRSLCAPVAVSERKFHDGPISPDLRAKFECEIALVSHHSETPEAMHERLRAQAGDANVAAIFQRVREGLQAHAADLTRPALRHALEDLTQRAAAEVLGSTPDGRATAHLLHAYTLPMADRLMRHEMLAWAAEAAERNGWRLRIYGRGWDAHPRFSRFARPPVEHGEELRACYQAAAVHLHGSIHWTLHQRVMECALSGGLPLYRLKWDDVETIRLFTVADLAERGVPFASALGGALRRTMWQPMDNWRLAMLYGLLQQLGIDAPERAEFVRNERYIEHARALVRERGLDAETAWLCGDLALTSFRSREELETRAQRVIENPAMRADLSRGIARRVRRRYTYGSVMREVLALMQTSLKASAGAAR